MTSAHSRAENELRLTELLQRYGIGARRAQKNAQNELARWAPADVDAVLRQIDSGGRDHNPCGPEFNIYRGLGIGQKTFLYSCIGLGLACALPIYLVHTTIRLLKHRTFSVYKKTWDEYNLSALLSLVFEMDSYVKAPIKLIRQSIEEGKALCINKNGKFKIMDSGYAVMSHVWEETMGWNSPDGFGKVDLSLRKKGIYRGHFLKFFEKCGAEWLWVDVIAMPEILEDMSEAEKEETEKLRVGVVNNLTSIYRGADRTIVLDSLVMQLKTGSLIDVAVVLCLGRWTSRMWSVAEGRLGKRILVKTGDGETDLDEIISLLHEIATDPSHRYFDLAKTLHGIRGNRASRDTRCSLAELVKAYRFAYTGEDADSVRAAYPLLGLSWHPGWGQNEGMRNLITQLSDESPLLAGLCGERGIHEPYGWVPLKLNTLRGALSPGLQLTEDGLLGKWKMITVYNIEVHGGNGSIEEPLNVDLTIMGSNEPRILVTQILTTYSLSTLEESFESGTLRLLYPEMADELTSFLVVLLDESSVLRTAEHLNTGRVVGSGLRLSGGARDDPCSTVSWLLR